MSEDTVITLASFKAKRKKKASKLYDINQSPLYKLNNHSRLANYLQIDLDVLLNVAARGDKNYFFTTIHQEKSSPRDLEVPKQQLMRIHRKLQKFLSRIKTPDYLYSGVKDRSNVRNGNCHINSKYMHKIDIKSFYKSTSQKQVKKCFLNVFKTTDDIAETLSKLCCANDHIATGSPISQSLAFFTNIKMFAQINSFCAVRNIKFSLYVDDLTFSSDTKFDPIFFNKMKLLFSKNSSYKLHKFCKFNENTPKPVTGVVLINNKMYVPNNQRLKINIDLSKKKHIISIIASEPAAVEKYFQSLIGRLYSAGQISPKYKLLGKEIVNERKALGVNAMNRKKTKSKSKSKKSKSVIKLAYASSAF